MRLWPIELRKRLFIDRNLQGRVILRVIGYWTIYHGALWHSLFLVRYLQHRLQTLSGTQAQSFQEQYVTALQDSQALIWAAALLLPAAIWEAVRQSHRIAGPIYRFQETLKALMAGRAPASIQLRKGDLLQGFEQTMNDFLAFYASQGHATGSHDSTGRAPATRPKVTRTTI